MVLFGGDGRDGARDGVRVRGGRPLTPAAPRVAVRGQAQRPSRTARAAGRRASWPNAVGVDADPDRPAHSQPSSLKVVRVQLEVFPKFLPALSCAAL